ncbi:efflux RND transporter periplasmic adaptor subunit [Polyangium aurulentum]|uniref:efflux RND transporter periplasmic adaptor subunit n=1 Tax=Polyangium aurulentum TaxID=2567896 RepID=UPI0010ADD345|nr:efflux RND transporter periplasmic adaptor subunit [Polyangium aurulentum]UQA58706.1 efflux RND transporter periplasmic adaptor subunit [Polyangium aurulentum]
MRAKLALFFLLVQAGCAEPEAAPQAQAASSDLERKSAESPWVAARAPDKLSLLEAPAELLPPPGARGAVVPPFSARVVRVHVQEGQRVEAGAAIVDVVMPELARAAGAYGAAATRLAAQSRRKTQLEALRQDGLTRLGDVAEVEGAIADASAESQIALATLKIAGMGPKDAAGLVASGGSVTLKSPVAGVVTELSAAIGETRDPAGVSLARIEGEGAARVEARLSQRPPPNARFAFVGPSGQSYPITLMNQAPGTSGRDGSLPAWFDPVEPLPLPHGTLGKVRVMLDDKGGIVAVPAAAVALRDGGAVVLAKKTGAALPVKVLASSGADALVEGALAPGDEVAADAARTLAAAERNAP